MPDFPSITQLAIPLFVGAILMEMAVIYFARKRGDDTKGEYETRDTLTSLLMGTGNVIAGILLGFIAYGFWMWFWQFRLFDLGFTLPVLFLCFILDDLRYYWYHRIAHRCRWVWAEHVNHHSSQHYNLSTALRQSWTGTFTGMFVLRLPLVLLGFHPAILVFTYGFNLVYQFWIHTEAIRKMPWWFEAVMNTPSHHRVHHATNPRYLDANYAGTLIIWDKFFGTFVPELEDDAPRYGIIKNIATFNPIKVAFHEWVAMFKDAFRPGLTLTDRVKYLFMPPGWSHRAGGRGSAWLKADYVRRHPEMGGTPGLPQGNAVEPPAGPAE